MRQSFNFLGLWMPDGESIYTCILPVRLLNSISVLILQNCPKPSKLPKNQPPTPSYPENSSFPNQSSPSKSYNVNFSSFIWPGLLRLIWNKTLHYSSNQVFSIWTIRHPGELRLRLVEGVLDHLAHFYGPRLYLTSLIPFHALGWFFPQF